jgi:putative transposase
LFAAQPKRISFSSIASFVLFDAAALARLDRPIRVKGVILTYRYRVKDATTAKRLRAHAVAVNCVWNFSGETQEAARRQEKRWPSAFDLIKLTTRSSSLLGLHSDTVQAVCRQFVVNRDAARRRPHWRGKKSLGWIPFAAARAIKLDGDAVIYLSRRYRLWRSRPVDGKIKTGCFAQDARGRWYLSLQVEIAESQTCGAGEIGVDLGLSTLATLSDGRKIENPRHFKKYKSALAKAQRARNKKRVQGIHAKIANARRHYLHVQSTKLVRENRLIVIGNVVAKSLRFVTWNGRRSSLAARRHCMFGGPRTASHRFTRYAVTRLEPCASFAEYSQTAVLSSRLSAADPHAGCRQSAYKAHR